MKNAWSTTSLKASGRFTFIPTSVSTVAPANPSAQSPDGAAKLGHTDRDHPLVTASPLQNQDADL